MSHSKNNHQQEKQESNNIFIFASAEKKFMMREKRDREGEQLSLLLRALRVYVSPTETVKQL